MSGSSSSCTASRRSRHPYSRWRAPPVGRVACSAGSLRSVGVPTTPLHPLMQHQRGRLRAPGTIVPGHPARGCGGAAVVAELVTAGRPGPRVASCYRAACILPAYRPP